MAACAPGFQVRSHHTSSYLIEQKVLYLKWNLTHLTEKIYLDLPGLPACFSDGFRKKKKVEEDISLAHNVTGDVHVVWLEEHHTLWWLGSGTTKVS